MALSRSALKAYKDGILADGQAAGAITEQDERNIFEQFADSSVMWDDLGVITANGTDTYTFTAPGYSASIHAAIIRVKFQNTNTGPSTLGDAAALFPALAIKKNGTEALIAGDIIAGVVYHLAMDGTNYQIVGVTPSRGVNIQDLVVSRSLSTAEILSANSSPVELVAAPGAGYAFIPYEAILVYDYNTAAFATNTDFFIRVGTTNSLNYGAAALTNTSDAIFRIAATNTSYSTASHANQNINFFIDTGNPTGGGTSSARIIVKYYKITL